MYNAPADSEFALILEQSRGEIILCLYVDKDYLVVEYIRIELK